MTTQEKTLHLIQTFGYNSRQVSEVLQISEQVARRKMNAEKYEKFTDEQIEKLREHFREVHDRQDKALQH